MRHLHCGLVCNVGNTHRSASPKLTTLKEDQELFVDFSSILCLWHVWFEIQGMRTYNFLTEFHTLLVWDICHCRSGTPQVIDDRIMEMSLIYVYARHDSANDLLAPQNGITGGQTALAIMPSHQHNIYMFLLMDAKIWMMSLKLTLQMHGAIITWRPRRQPLCNHLVVYPLHMQWETLLKHSTLPHCSHWSPFKTLTTAADSARGCRKKGS